MYYHTLITISHIIYVVLRAISETLQSSVTYYSEKEKLCEKKNTILLFSSLQMSTRQFWAEIPASSGSDEALRNDMCQKIRHLSTRTKKNYTEFNDKCKSASLALSPLSFSINKCGKKGCRVQKKVFLKLPVGKSED